MKTVTSCLKPVFTIFTHHHKKQYVGCSGHEDIEDDWEISFEKLKNIQWISSGSQGAVFIAEYKGKKVAIKKIDGPFNNGDFFNGAEDVEPVKLTIESYKKNDKGQSSNDTKERVRASNSKANGSTSMYLDQTSAIVEGTNQNGDSAGGGMNCIRKVSSSNLFTTNHQNLKTLNCKKNSNVQRERERFKFNHLNESSIKQLDHPNVLKFIGSCFWSTNYCLVMEYCPKGQLFQVLREREHVSNARFLEWTKQITAGMHYLHGKGIVHRDLKSPNILVSYEDVLKISDFEDSKRFNNNLNSIKMSFTGTVAWMAPEIIRNQSCSEKVDVWSFGVVIWEILTMDIPYKNIDTSAIIWGVGNGTLSLPLPKQCFPGIKLLLLQCWNHVPRNRPSFEQITKHLDIASAEILAMNPENYENLQKVWREDLSKKSSYLVATVGGNDDEEMPKRKYSSFNNRNKSFIKTQPYTTHFMENEENGSHRVVKNGSGSGKNREWGKVKVGEGSFKVKSEPKRDTMVVLASDVGIGRIPMIKTQIHCKKGGGSGASANANVSSSCCNQAINQVSSKAATKNLDAITTTRNGYSGSRNNNTFWNSLIAHSLRPSPPDIKDVGGPMGGKTRCCQQRCSACQVGQRKDENNRGTYRILPPLYHDRIMYIDESITEFSKEGGSSKPNNCGDGFTKGSLPSCRRFTNGNGSQTSPLKRKLKREYRNKMKLAQELYKELHELMRSIDDLNQNMKRRHQVGYGENGGKKWVNPYIVSSSSSNVFMTDNEDDNGGSNNANNFKGPFIIEEAENVSKRDSDVFINKGEKSINMNNYRTTSGGPTNNQTKHRSGNDDTVKRYYHEEFTMKRDHLSIHSSLENLKGYTRNRRLPTSTRRSRSKSNGQKRCAGDVVVNNNKISTSTRLLSPNSKKLSISDTFVLSLAPTNTVEHERRRAYHQQLKSPPPPLNKSRNIKNDDVIITSLNNNNNNNNKQQPSGRKVMEEAEAAFGDSQKFHLINNNNFNQLAYTRQCCGGTTVNFDETTNATAKGKDDCLQVKINHKIPTKKSPITTPDEQQRGGGSAGNKVKTEPDNPSASTKTTLKQSKSFLATVHPKSRKIFALKRFKSSNKSKKGSLRL